MKTSGSHSIPGSNQKGTHTWLGLLELSLLWIHSTLHMGRCGYSWSKRAHHSYKFHTLLHTGSWHHSFQAHNSNTVGHQACTSNWLPLHCTCTSYHQLFLRRPVQFLMWMGRLSFPTWCRPLHHHWEQEDLVDLANHSFQDHHVLLWDLVDLVDLELPSLHVPQFLDQEVLVVLGLLLLHLSHLCQAAHHDHLGLAAVQ